MKFNKTDLAQGFVARLDSVGLKPAVRELAGLLIEQRLHSQLDEILTEVAREYARVHGIVEAQARTAFPLSSELKKELAGHVKQSTGAKEVILSEEIDKSLLGGVVVSAPDMELDLSLKTKLARLRV